METKNQPDSNNKNNKSYMNASSNTNNPLVQINQDINTLSRRIRMIEERYYNIRKKTQITDQNMLEDKKKVNVYLDYFKTNIKELKIKILDISEKLSMFDEELNETAKKRDITLINKYLDFWEPINFVTEKEATLIIKDVLDNLNIKKNR